MMQFPKFNSGETLWETYLDKDCNLIYAVTSKKDRSQYFLYSITDGTAKKVAKAKTPDSFQDIIPKPETPKRKERTKK